MGKATSLLTIIATILFFAFTLSAPASADPNGPGNNGTVNLGAVTTPTPTPAPTVAGVQTPPNSNAVVGAVTPIVELPGGSNQQSPNNAVNGVQTAPNANAVNGIQSLPSTSTDRTPTIPLATIGLALMGLGGALLRKARVTS